MGFSKSRKHERKTLQNRSLEDVLREFRDDIKCSEMFKFLCGSLEPYRDVVDRVRCLAIGSFHDEFPAKYQMALLCELVSFFSADVQVSIYDPVFTKEDYEYVTNLHNWSVSQEPPCWIKDSTRTLFFLPHAPLDLTEQVLQRECPHLWLANHAVAHTDRYAEFQLYEKYPIMSKLVYLLNQETSELPLRTSGKETNTAGRTITKATVQQSTERDENAAVRVRTSVTTRSEEFTPFIPRRKRRNRKSFQAPQLDYAKINSHFESCRVLQDFNGGELLKNKPWINSFSDLALHLIE
ncbi:related to SRR1-like protein BER1 [Zygosaccharomyces bailii]|nr:related to SRR1-like protein BER1 [Zygosaccharomyces bailii]